MTSRESTSAALSAVRDAMIRRGLKFQADSTLKGQSGEDYKFDLAATNTEGDRFVAEVVGEDPVGSLLKTFMKTLDTKARAVVICEERSTTFVNLALKYGMLATDGKDIDHVFPRWYAGELSKVVEASAGSALGGTWRKARPLLDLGSKIITAGTLLAVHEVEALRIGGAPRSIVAGKSLLSAFRHLEPDGYYEWLWSSAAGAATELTEVGGDEPLENLVRAMQESRWGAVLVSEAGQKQMVMISDLLQFYESGKLSTTLNIGSVSTPVVRLPGKATLKEALETMLELGVRRIFISKDRFVSDRRLIAFLFSSGSLEEMRDNPENVLKHRLTEVGCGTAIAAAGSLLVGKAAPMLRPGTEDCLLTGRGVVTPWDLIVKPLMKKRLRFEGRGL